MERYKIDADQAFTVLVRVSQQHNRKLRAKLANWLSAPPEFQEFSQLAPA
jgi:hypothetical protein